MTKKIFITGATGYIGGDVFATISKTHPEWEIAALVRSSDKGAQLAAAYPKTRLVYGSLEDAEILEEEGKKADIVLNCASADNEGAVSALVSGLATHKGYLIHTSGTGILMYKDLEGKVTPGTKLSDHIHDDWDNVGEVVSLPDFAPHRTVDKLVLNANGLGVNTAIVCPPAIYGETRGPTGVPSVQVPWLTRASLKSGQAIQVNEGLAWWNNVHVNDLGDLYLKLAEAAADGNTEVKWGPENYFFAENGEHIWKDISVVVAKEGKKQGLWETEDVKSVTAEEADQLQAHLKLLVGLNSRGKSYRARKLLNWQPSGLPIEKTVGETLRLEAESLGYSVGHAAKVAAE